MGEDPVKINHLLDLIFTYGPVWVYAVIFVACFIENIFPPFPGDSFIVAAGGLAAVHRLNFVFAFSLVVAGGLASVMVIYGIGRRFGRDFFLEKNYKVFSADDIHRAENAFDKYGAPILIFSRFVVGFRSALTLVAGISDYKAGRMLLYSLISYMLFTGLVMYLAAKLVENLHGIVEYFETYNKIAWPILILIVLLLILYKVKTLKKDRV
ncbi:MAG TPA: DedA family protein [candidate division Zixibacteria bacterium]|nr:DedA family protein [candidate division Zixibacteria bacterium]